MHGVRLPPRSRPRSVHATCQRTPRNAPSLSGSIELAVHSQAYAPIVRPDRKIDPTWLVRFLIESRYVHAAVRDGIDHGPFQTFRHVRGIRSTYVQELDFDLKRWIVQRDTPIEHGDHTPGWDYATQMEPWVYDAPALFLTHAYFLVFLYGTVGKRTMERVSRVHQWPAFHGFQGPTRGQLESFRIAYETTAQTWSTETVRACFETLDLATRRSASVFQTLEGGSVDEDDATN